MTTSSRPPSGATQRASIWLVDDSALEAELCLRAIAASADVKVFENGTSMLEALGPEGSPELLILDWYLPDLSGLEICEFIRENRDSGELPILMLTGKGTQESVVTALEAGANDFLMKPFSDGELRARVAALLRNKALHASLRETQQQLRVEAEFRERFIGMLAHDLRQPLNTFVLANASMTDASREGLPKLLQMQRSAAERMTRMVNELLDFARTRPDRGMPVNLQSMDFAALVAGLLEEIRLAHPSHHFQLDVRGECRGRWDRDRLTQLCGNLLGNAIEHGAPGAPIAIRVQRDGSAVVLSVSNQGEQIPEQALPSLFEPFRRGPRAGRRTTGVGLGLHIVSEIARAHGGTVEARSDARATTFLVTLPA